MLLMPTATAESLLGVVAGVATARSVISGYQWHDLQQKSGINNISNITTSISFRRW